MTYAELHAAFSSDPDTFRARSAVLGFTVKERIAACKMMCSSKLATAAEGRERYDRAVAFEKPYRCR